MQEQNLRIRVIEPKYESLFSGAVAKFNKMGFIYVSFGVIDISGNTVSYFSHTKWAEYYAKNSLMLYDPCLQHLMNTDRFMAIWSALPRGHNKFDVMSVRDQMVGIQDGVSLYYRYSSGVKSIVGLGTQTREQLDHFLLMPRRFELDEAVENLNKAYERFTAWDK